MLQPALELDMPALPLREPVLLGIRRPCSPEQPEAIAPQAETQGFLRSGKIELVDVERLQVPENLDLDTLRKSLKHHGIEASMLVDTKGKFAFGEREVPIFLDVVEGRWFEDDFSPEKRRADRFSKRQPPPRPG